MPPEEPVLAFFFLSTESTTGCFGLARLHRHKPGLQAAARLVPSGEIASAEAPTFETVESRTGLAWPGTVQTRKLPAFFCPLLAATSGARLAAEMRRIPPSVLAAGLSDGWLKIL